MQNTTENGTTITGTFCALLGRMADKEASRALYGNYLTPSDNYSPIPLNPEPYPEPQSLLSWSLGIWELNANIAMECT